MKEAKVSVLKQIIDMATEEFLKKAKNRKAKGVAISVSTIKPEGKKDLKALRQKLME